METFSAEWLALREPADHAARAAPLVTLAVDALAAYAPRVVTVVDLAAGTGSNLRYLSSRLPFGQRWTLVDHDPALLDTAVRRWDSLGDSVLPDVTIHPLRGDLARLEESVFTAAAARAPEAPLFVTASALLDLTSPAWLDLLAARCRMLRAVVLCALTYDGRIACEPFDPADELILALVNRHQQTDKGFGAAAGPDATDAAAQAFEGHDYAVHRAASDWVLGPESQDLQQQLVDGWAAAAAETSPTDARAVAAWRDRRRVAIQDRTSRIVVGHQDLVALL